MRDKDLPDDVFAKVRSWLGADASVRHFWKIDDTFLIIARGIGSGLYCLRVFPVGNSLELSQDNVLYGS